MAFLFLWIPVWIPFGYLGSPLVLYLVRLFAMAQEKASFSIVSGESSQASEPILNVDENVSFISNES